MIDYMFRPFSKAEFKLSEFLVRLKEQAPRLCDYISYRKEITNDNTVISIKIDGKSYYNDRYADFCNKMCVNIEVIANEFSFPDTVVVELPDCVLPHSRLYVYNGDDCEDAEFSINGTELIIETIVSLWSFYKLLYNNV